MTGVTILKRIIFSIIITIVSVILLIIDLFFKEYHLTLVTAFLSLFCIILWYYTLHKWCNKKRLEIFISKIEKIDRFNDKYKTMFIIYDYINGNENNMDVVTNALKEVYFYSKYMIKFPLKFKRKAYYNGLIEYYLSITKDSLGSSFIFDYNKNYFTWKIVSILLLFGATGIAVLMYVNNSIVENLSILNTFLYVIFGLSIIPFIVKVYDHLF